MIVKAQTDEHPEDRASRIRIHEANEKYDNRKDAWLLIFAGALVLVGTAICVWFILFAPNATPSQQGWAQAILGAILGAVMGYMLPKRKER